MRPNRTMPTITSVVVIGRWMKSSEMPCLGLFCAVIVKPIVRTIFHLSLIFSLLPLGEGLGMRAWLTTDGALSPHPNPLPKGEGERLMRPPALHSSYPSETTRARVRSTDKRPASDTT